MVSALTNRDRLKLFCVVLILFASQARAERLPVKTYTTDDGLPRNHIRQVFQDSRGYLWIVTPSGISRFDGYGFTNYGAEQNIPYPNISRMIEDQRGGYWLATNGNGLCRFIPRLTAGNMASRFDNYPLGDNPPMKIIATVHQDHSGKVWAGGTGGLFSLDEAKGETAFRRIEIEPFSKGNLQVLNIEEDPEGSLWITTNTGLFRRLPDERIIHYRIAPGKDTGADQLLYDGLGRLWIEQSSELIVFVPEPAGMIDGDVVFHYLPGNAVLKNGENYILPTKPGQAQRFRIVDKPGDEDIGDLHQSADGRILVATRQGLYQFSNGTIENYTAENGLCSNALQSIGEDTDGNLWVGTRGSGLMKIARNGFTSFTQADGLEEGTIVFMFEDSRGVFYAATDKHQLGRFDGKRFHSIPSDAFKYPVDVGRAFNNPILRDRAGEWWIGTRKGVNRWSGVDWLEQLSGAQPKHTYTKEDGFPNDVVYRIFEDSRGDIWLSFLNSSTRPLARWERAADSFRFFGEAEGLSPLDRVSAFCEDNQGNLWMGFIAQGLVGGGVARYSAGRFTVFSPNQGAPEVAARMLFLDSRGRIWIATDSDGLVRVDNPASDSPSFSKYTVAEGLADNEVNSVAEDRWGYIYAATARGIDRLDPATGSIRHYTMIDGLPSSNVNRIIRDHQKNFWIGTPNGLAYFVPTQEPPKPPPPVLITKLIIAGQEHPISELGERQIPELELEADQNNLKIDFVSPAFGFAKAIRYEYMLEGSREGWLSITRPTINFSSLSAGAYRFIVRAINEDGSAGQEPATISFRVLRPFWLRWWFLILSAAILAVPVSFIIRYRYRHKRAEEALHRAQEERLIELEQVRRRIATDLHDDVGSSLTQISLLTEVVRQRINGAENSVGQRLSLIARISRELVDSMSDIVWSINPSKDTLSDLSQRMRLFASDVFTARQIRFHFLAPDEEEDIKVDTNTRRELFLAFKEAVNNIVRHSRCSEANIEFRFDSESLLLEVSDNGEGFDTSEGSDGNGLASMKERLKSLGGRFEIISEPGEGTTLRFTIPLKSHHPAQ